MQNPALNKAKITFSGLVSRLARIIQIFNVYQAPTSQVLASEPRPASIEMPIQVDRITRKDVAPFVEARPNYGRMAEEYFDDGHECIVIRLQDEIAAMGWFTLPGDERRILHYYPVLSQVCWLHADWTSPNWRGNGLHSRVIFERAKAIEQLSKDNHHVLECNILPSNTASIRNYEKLGFTQTGRMLILDIPKIPTLAWRLR